MNERLATAARVAKAYTSDSRECEADFIFVALKGENSDGHDYVERVLATGPALVVVDRKWTGLAKLKSDKLFPVDDPHAAHRFLAGEFRRKFKGKVIAVGGSSGKTSAKEFIAAILAERFRTAKTEKSQNGELGIPRTLERLRPGVEVAVVEVGIDAPGDMARHAALVQPDLAVLTSIGEEHLNLLKNVENVFAEEKILFDVTLARGGIGYAPGSDAWLRRLAGTPRLVLVPADPTLYSVKAAKLLRDSLPNAYAIQNATIALAIAKELGMSETEILRAIPKLALPEGRGNVLPLAGGVTLIADHYNSNPSSLKAGLQSAAERSRLLKQPLHLILGDMLDLGDMSAALHASVVGDIVGARPASLRLIGPEFFRLKDEFARAGVTPLTFGDSSEAADEIKTENLRDAVVLLKGSRGMKLERVLSKLRDV